MTNEIAKVNGGGAVALTAEQAAMVAAMQQGMTSAVAARPAYSSTPLLRMLKGDAAWVYGPDDIEVEQGSLWAVNPLACSHGYVAWAAPESGRKASEKKLGETMVLMSQPKPAKETLADKGVPWSDQVGLQLKCLNGEDTGLEVLFKSNSQGGLDGGMALVDAIRRKMGEGTAAIVPKVRLTSTNYQHKDWGKIHKPIFEIVGWMFLDGTEAKAAAQAMEPDPEVQENAAAAAPEPHQEEQPQAASARSRRTASTAAPQPAAAEPAARRRRSV